MYFPVLYAETHYRLKYLVPLYYKKEPEIIADIPSRVIVSKSKSIPVLLIIKDADKFPIYIKQVTIKILNDNSPFFQVFVVNKKIKLPYFSKIFNFFPPENFNIRLNIVVQIDYLANGKERSILQDNYCCVKKIPFVCYYTNESLPFPNGWYAGDAHYHSNYTSDQVEFGADIYSTKIIAKAMGLDWFFVTDHSYDLDDKENDYLKNDPGLEKWKLMKRETAEYSDDKFKIIFGEEVSVGNYNNQNVHLLVINSNKFYKGTGDSAEVWFKNKPDLQIKNIYSDIKSDKVLLIAAHPFEKVSFIQKKTLNRGVWKKEDLKYVKYLQIFNGNMVNDVFKLKKLWVNLLLDRKKFFIIAGNDAHGNFNFMKQIKIPFIKIFIDNKQTFGKWMTIFKYKTNLPIKGLQNGSIIISNGPFININLISKENNIYEVGALCKKGYYKINLEFQTNKEFGEIDNIKVYFGNYSTKTEREVLINTKTMFNNTGYIRAELYTKKGFMAFTNPIWIL